jgi:starvation-inducible DNA-binding protein
MRNINIGLTDQQRHGVIDLLNRDLADAYLLLVKTKKFHWDIATVFNTPQTLGRAL